MIAKWWRGNHAECLWKSHKRQKRLNLDVCIACEPVIMFKSYVLRLHIPRIGMPSCHQCWMVRAILFELCIVCLNGYIYECSVDHTLCTRAPHFISSPLSNVGGENTWRAIYGFFSPLNLHVAMNARQTRLALESKSFKKYYIITIATINIKLARNKMQINSPSGLVHQKVLLEEEFQPRWTACACGAHTRQIE